MSNQWTKPLKYKNIDGLAFAHNDHYPEIVVRNNNRRWFGVDIGGAKINAWPEMEGLFDVEIVNEPWCPNCVYITGKNPGGCWLGFYKEGDWDNDLGWVYVRVYPLKTLRVNIFAVRDGSGQWPQTTLASAQEMIKQINVDILKPQAGIVLRTHVVDGFTIEPNAAERPIHSGDSRQEGEAWKALKEKSKSYGISPSHLNLYLLRRWGNRDICVGGHCEKDVAGTGPIGQHHCVVEDQTDVWLQTTITAHEIMHSYGMTHNDTRGEGALMYSTALGGYMVYPEDVVEVRGEPG